MFQETELISIGDVEQLLEVVLLETRHDEIREIRDAEGFASIYDLNQIISIKIMHRALPKFLPHKPINHTQTQETSTPLLFSPNLRKG